MKWPDDLREQAKEILEEIYTSKTEPAKENVLSFFKRNPSEIRVVILGQDPYPTPGVANGRAFAVNKEVKIPQSLKNIFKEIDEIHGNHIADRTLSAWEEQGILLLNTSLTVKQFNPNSDKKSWKPFTDSLIEWMANNLNVVWVLWGNEARKYKKIIGNKTVIEDAHPSPLSVRHRKKQTFKEIDFIKW